jgi:hypothetical protein
MLSLANFPFNVQRLPAAAPPEPPQAAEAAAVAAARAAAAQQDEGRRSVLPLRRLCARVLEGAIDAGNAVGLLQLATDLELRELGARCSDFICAHLSRVLATEEFAALPPELQSALLLCAARVENPGGRASTAYHSPREFLAIVGEYCEEVSARLAEATAEVAERRRRSDARARRRGGRGSGGAGGGGDAALAYAEGKVASQRVRVAAVRRYRDNQRALFAQLARAGGDGGGDGGDGGDGDGDDDTLPGSRASDVDSELVGDDR